MKKYSMVLVTLLALILTMIVPMVVMAAPPANPASQIESDLSAVIWNMCLVGLAFIKPFVTLGVVGLIIFLAISHDETAVKRAKIALIICAVATVLSWSAKPLTDLFSK